MYKTLIFNSTHIDDAYSTGIISHCPVADLLKVTGAFYKGDFKWFGFSADMFTFERFEESKFLKSCAFVDVFFYLSIEDTKKDYVLLKRIDMKMEENETEMMNYIRFMHDIDAVVILYCLLKLNIIL